MDRKYLIDKISKNDKQISNINTKIEKLNYDYNIKYDKNKYSDINIKDLSKIINVKLNDNITYWNNLKSNKINI